jgi:hypothetical protein
MRATAWLCCIVPCAWTVTANVEKTIFVVPPTAASPNESLDLKSFHLEAISPNSSLLETRLPVQFASAGAPRGLESWYLLQGLEEGRRYEVRICWPATVCLASIMVIS